MRFFYLISIVLTLSITGCGGGGGGGGGSGPSIPNPNPGGGTTLPANPIAGVDYTDPSQFMQTTSIPTYLQQINAQVAHNNGFTGGNLSLYQSYTTVSSDFSNRNLQTVSAVLDSGILSSHEEFSDVGKIVGFKDFTAAANNTPHDNFGHGTFVSSVISGKRQDQNDIIYGVSYNSELLIGNVVSADGSIWSNHLQAAIDWVNTQSLSINIPNTKKLATMNLSLGTTNQAFVDSGMLSSLSTTLNNNISVIVASGNEGLDCLPNAGGSVDGKCSFPAALPWVSGNSSQYLNNNGAWIVVGSVDSNNIISTFSNKAGITKSNYLVAPGENIIGASNSGNTNYIVGSGTSFATPLVVGAMNLMAQKWPYLNGRQQAQILFDTATDLGVAGIDDIYGHGLLNLSAAFNPIGTLSIPSSPQNVSNGNVSGVNITKTKMSTSSTMAAALRSFEPLNNTIAIDSRGRDYKISLGDSISSTGSTANDFENYVNLKYGNVIFGFEQYKNIPMIGYQFNNDLIFRASYDADTMFGSSGDGALGLSNASSLYLNIEKNIKINDKAKISIIGNYGYAKASGAEGSIVDSVNSVQAVGGSVKASFDGFGIGYKIPLHIIDGTMTVNSPTGVDSSGNVLYTKTTANLKGNTLEQAYSLFYKKEFNTLNFLAEVSQTRDAYGINNFTSNDAKISLNYFY